MRFASNHDQSSIQAFASLRLTPRESEVLFWISQGKTNHDIGVILGAKTGTICKHVEYILTKLNVENRTSAAVVALEACGSGAPQAESHSGASWDAIAGGIATPLVELCPGSCDFCDAFSALVA
jgi:DNA-binding CsgD family transcriptional regulator